MADQLGVDRAQWAGVEPHHGAQRQRKSSAADPLSGTGASAIIWLRNGLDGKCGRKPVRKTPKRMRSAHRRRWLAGKPLDTAVRGYQRNEEGPDGNPIRASRAPSPKRKSPFGKEYALLRSLGLR